MSASINPEATNVVRSSIPFFTVREKAAAESPEKMFGDERGKLHSGFCNISWTPFKVLRTIDRSLPVYVPQGRGSIQGLEVIPGEQIWLRLKEKLAGRKPMLFVHGYNVSFRKNMLRGRNFQFYTKMEERLVLFNWPSAGRTVEYTRDESNMEWSVHYLQQVILGLLHHFGPGGFDLAAHSLGSRGLHLALQGLGRSWTGRGVLSDNLILLAGDIDADYFRQNLEVIRPTCNRLTVYVSDSDRALALSQEIHGYPRLGEAGDHLRDMPGVDFIDASRLPVQRVSGHLYHIDNGWISADLRLLLHDRLAPDDRKLLTRSNSMGGSSYWYIDGAG